MLKYTVCKIIDISVMNKIKFALNLKVLCTFYTISKICQCIFYIEKKSK